MAPLRTLAVQANMKVDDKRLPAHPTSPSYSQSSWTAARHLPFPSESNFKFRPTGVVSAYDTNMESCTSCASDSDSSRPQMCSSSQIRPSSHTDTNLPARSPTPKAVKPLRSLTSPARPKIGHPHTRADEIDTIRLPQESILPASSILRPALRSHTENNALPPSFLSLSDYGSPGKKVVRKRSTNRLRKDSGTSGHSHSPSLPRTSTSTSYTTTTSSSIDQADFERPGWLDRDPTLSQPQSQPQRIESFPIRPVLISRISASSSMPSMSNGVSMQQTSEQPQRKTSFYRRKRSQTASNLLTRPQEMDGGGFPLFSPMSEVVKAMPIAPRRRSSSNLVTSISSPQKLTNRSHTIYPSDPSNLPTSSDYFGGSSVLPPKVAEESKGRHWLPSFRSAHRRRDEIPIPALSNPSLPDPFSESSDPFGSSELTTGLSLSKSSSSRRLARSASCPSTSRSSRSPSISEPVLISHNGIPIPPVPALSTTTRQHYEASEEQAKLSAEVMLSPESPKFKSSHLLHRRAMPFTPQPATPPPRTPTPARNLSLRKNVPNFSPTLAMPRSPGSPRTLLLEYTMKPPASPKFYRTARSNSSTSKLDGGLAVSKEEAREAKFMELLTKSDQAVNGIIKVSLTSKAAQSAGA